MSYCWLTSLGNSDRRFLRRQPPATNGFSLLELLIILSLVATLLAVAVPAFVSSLRTSKLSEAPALLADMHRGTAAYYHSPQGKTQQLRCIPLSAGPTPSKAHPSRRKFDFYAAHSPGAATWKSIGFNPKEPIRFRYTLQTKHPGCDQNVAPLTPLVTFSAEGDLDGDAQHSLFRRSGGVTAQGDFVPLGALYSHHRTE